MEFSHPKRPRQYAVEIAALPKEQRRAAIEQAPSEYRDWIAQYLVMWSARGRLRQAARLGAAHVA